MFFGFILLAIGVGWILQHFGYIPADLAFFWPVLFIAIGLSFIFGGWGRKGWWDWCCRDWSRNEPRDREHSHRDCWCCGSCFGREEGEEKYTDRPMGRIHLFTKEDVEKLFGEHFNILETNISELPDEAPGKFFWEFLMEKPD